MRFRDRTDAGRQLARRLQQMRLVQPVVLALPRGGVPVAFEAADALDAPLDVFVARKVGAPGHTEYGIGAIAEGGVVVADEDALRMLGVSQGRFEQLLAVEKREVDRRVQQYRRGRDLVEMRDRDVVLIDDGLATGVTAEAALRALRQRRPHRLVLAVPACAPETAARLEGVADEVVCLIAPADFNAVGWWYANFDQTSDNEVLDLLDRASDTSRMAR
jgi:putative phosphoribosyl transferase